jgi:putative DNA primase/helicase
MMAAILNTALAAACADVGIAHRDVPVDGRWHATDVEGDLAGKGDGRIKLFPDGEGGIVCNWKGDTRAFFANDARKLSRAERAELVRKRREAIRRNHEEAARRQAEAATKAADIWAKAIDAPPDHAYLMQKGIKPHGTKADCGSLLVPMRKGGKLRSVQFIRGNGEKRFLPDGEVTGCYYAIGKPNGALCVCEGFATGASIHEATGHAVAVAFNAGNLGAVAKTLRGKFPDLPLILCGDFDKSGTGQQAATDAAQAVGGLVALPDFTPDELAGDKPPTDFNDLARLRDAGAVGRAIAGASEPARHKHQPGSENAPAGDSGGKPTDRAAIERLAALSPLEYDRVRIEEAKALGVRQSTLDKLVTSERKADENYSGIEDIDPWPEPVEPCELLNDIAATVRRFIVCQHETADAVALWVAMTWLMDVVQVAPLAVITAPEKRCGKSLLLFLLGRLACRPLTASNISPAALFRCIDAWNPTLLVDEADAFARENEELRGLLNCGHTRDGAYVVRTVGDDHTPRKFNTWGAKALAGIGKLADTLMDRAIVIELRRKLPHEQVERLRHAEPDLFETLAEKLARFAEDYRGAVRQARPELPAKLNDRAQDNWEPLLAIADTAGEAWHVRSRKAALKLSGAEDATMSTGTELLADIKEVFEAKRVDRISSADLIQALCEDDEMPWATYNRGKPISPRQVAKRLADYGIRSKSVRIGCGTPKGYLLEWFDEAFSRYLSDPPSVSATPQQFNNGAGFSVADNPPRCGNKNESATPEAPPIKGCCGVADRTEKSESTIIEVEI